MQNGQNVTLGCNITAVPNHTNVYWRKQTSEFITNITSSDQRIIDMTNAKPSLTILSTRTNDSGLYTCYADNLVGSGYSMYTNLTVFGSKSFSFRQSTTHMYSFFFRKKHTLTSNFIQVIFCQSIIL